MRFNIEHTTRVQYESAVTEAVMLARLGPLSDSAQAWEGFALTAEPGAAIEAFTDALGNVTHLITVPDAQTTLEVTATSTVSTLLADPLQSVEPEVVVGLTSVERFDYLRPSLLVPDAEGLTTMAAPFRTPDSDSWFDSVRSLMTAVHEHFTYERFVTNVGTTAADALALRRGVCQDFTHVLIGLCRANGIPARYASGYLVASEDPGDDGQQSPSAASHAWVEAWTPTHGWRGFDPTNNHIVALNHVKMAVGRDYSDVPPTRGTSRGAGNERLYVRLKVERLDSDSGNAQ